MDLLLHRKFHIPWQVGRGNRVIKEIFCKNMKIHCDFIETTAKQNEHQVHVWFNTKKN